MTGATSSTRSDGHAGVHGAMAPIDRATPAKAGAQLGSGGLAGAALNNFDLSNWAPAFAGVVFQV
ncbi:hypothetical protein [Sphingomonas sp. CFBP 13706]|uniref:hypothetical protein n=1 Tax=Sphingomonas sp. CFBP 13706 TaxID=2775314 RepID=UPI001A7EFA2B|nr:hypothetical protein [Sphingomonas sp. CFBP 13706]